MRFTDMRIVAAAALAAFFVTSNANAQTVPQPAEAPASAAHTVDMTHVLLDERGVPAKDLNFKEAIAPGQVDPDPKCDKCPPLTLGLAVSHALFASFPNDHDTNDQKWARGDLAQRIRNDPKAALSADEVAVIKKQIGEAYGGVVLMQAYPLLDPNAKVPAVK